MLQNRSCKPLPKEEHRGELIWLSQRRSLGSLLAWDHRAIRGKAIDQSEAEKVASNKTIMRASDYWPELPVTLSESHPKRRVVILAEVCFSLYPYGTSGV
jgi:hypothetical protein